MINRNLLPTQDTLLSKSLCCYPPENEAAKIYAQFLSEHPEFSTKDVDMRIDAYEREEDHYGNGGGYDRYVRIYKRRDETPEERDNRVRKEENEVIEKFSKNIGNQIYDFCWAMYGYHPQDGRLSDEERNHLRDILENIVNERLKK